jgi:hypothetical protein
MHKTATTEFWKFIDTLYHATNTKSNRKKIFEVELVKRRAPRYYERVPYGRRYARHDAYYNKEKKMRKSQENDGRLSLYLMLIPGGTAEQGLTGL